MRTEDSEKLALLWTAAQTEVSAFIRMLVVDPDATQDLLQQVAVKAVRNFATYDPTRPFIPWAIGIARNEVLAWRRGRATDRHVFDETLIEQAAELFEQLVDDQRPRRAALRRCLEEVVEARGRQALELYYQEGQKCPAIASIMAMTAGAVRMLLSRSREALRRCVERRLSTQGGE
jgi:RNA polymerase sigma-70 factor (ECF subfamily)